MTRAILVLALLMAGCSAAAGGSPSADAAVATDTVDMPPSYRFEPAAISVASGTEVTWTNSDNFTHTVSIDGEVVGQAEPDDTITHTFTEPGSYDYVCSLHPQNMKGVVVVE